MAQRVMTTGGYPIKLPDADEISQDVSGDLMSRKISINQLTGMSDAVSSVVHAKTPQEIRDAAGIQESQIAVKGDAGESAYEVAVQEGFEGSQTEWLESLHGKDGQDGVDGQDGSDGIDGRNGVDGKSAYQIALDDGYVGTEMQWLASLKGIDGKDGVNGKDGINGVDGKNGTNGKDGTNATPTLFEVIESKVVTAGTKVAIKFTKPFTTPPIVQPSPAWNGAQMIIGQASDITTTGCNVTVMQSRGALLLTTGPFENAAANAPFRMFVIGT